MPGPADIVRSTVRIHHPETAVLAVPEAQ